MQAYFSKSKNKCRGKPGTENFLKNVKVKQQKKSFKGETASYVFRLDLKKFNNFSSLLKSDKKIFLLRGRLEEYNKINMFFFLNFQKKLCYESLPLKTNIVVSDFNRLSGRKR